MPKQTRLVEQQERSPRVAFGQHARQLIADALPRHHLNLFYKLLNGCKCSGIDLVRKSRCKPHSPQHAELIFAKAPPRIPNRADDSSLEITAAADIIEHLSADRIE